MTLSADVSFTEVIFQICEQHDHEALEAILNNAENVDDAINLRDPSGQTPLYCAVACQSVQCARVLLEHGADPNFSCSLAYFCRTPLHFCAAEGAPVEVVELLLNHGAEPLLQDLHGDTCLTLANRYNHFDLHSLMSTAAEQRDQMFELIVNQFETLLLNGDIDAAKNCLLSIRNRRQTFLKHLSRRAQPLIVQCVEKNLGESVRILAENGVDCMSIIVEPNSDTVLHVAARFGSEKAATVILDKWPSLVCRVSAIGRLALHDACERGRANIVRLFLSYNYPRSITLSQQSPFGCYEYPFDVNHADADSRTPLLDACASGNVDTVKALLDCRVTSVGVGIGGMHIPLINSPSYNGHTPVGSLSNYVSNLFRRIRVPSTGGSTGLPISHSFQPGATSFLTTPTRPARSGSVISLEDRSMQTFSDFEIVSPQPKPSNPGEAYCPLDVNAFSYDRSTPLLTAIRIQNRAIVGLLLQSGADAELPAQWRGYTVTPLQAAVELRDADLVDLLLQNGAIDADCSALEAALKMAPHLVPIFLRRWSEVDRDTQINIESVAELAELSRCKTEQVLPVAINWRQRPQLKELPQAWLVGCAIFHNPALMLDDFVACSVITRLDISCNALRALPSYVFHMQSLQTLNAASNQIEEISAGGIQRSFLSSSIREIDLSFNRLQTIPAFIFWLRRLTKLYADNNAISTLPTDIWENSSLSELKLAHNRLESLPVKRFGRAPSMPKSLIADPTAAHQQQREHQLSIASIFASKQRNRFTPSPASSQVGSFTAEKATELQQHDLWSIEQSSDVGVVADENSANNGSNESAQPNTCGIRFLDLSHNQITIVPSSLVCLAPLLRILNLSNNGITVITRWPADFPQALHTLDLSHNRVTTFAAAFDDKAVGEVSLPCANPAANSDHGTADERARSTTRPDSRRIRSRSADRRKGSDADRRHVAVCSHRQHNALARLRTLNVSNNGMSAFNFDSASAPGLTQLDLSQNKINSLPHSITLLTNLSVLNVSNTLISTLPPELSRLNRLWSLEISNCPLSGELGSLARGKVRTADIIYHLRASLDRARLRPITRLLICGLPGSGKSSLAEALRRAATSHSPPSGQQNNNNGQDMSQPLIDWGQVTVDYRPDGALTFRVAELSTGKPDFRYVCGQFLTQRAVVVVTFKLTDQPTSHVVDSIASLVRDVNLLIPSAPVLIVGTFADVLAESIFEGGASDVMPLWRRKLTAAFQTGEVPLPSSTSTTSSQLDFLDMSGSEVVPQTDEALLPGNCKLMIVSAKKNRKQNGGRLLREAHRLAFDWRSSGGSGGVGRNATPGHGHHYQSPPTLKQTVPAVFADLEIVVGRLANSLSAAKLPPLLKSTAFQDATRQQLQELNLKPYRDADELNQCVQFLHEIGLVVHFDEPSVADLYFLSVQWLSRLLADIIQTAANSATSPCGLLTIQEVETVFARYEPTGMLSSAKLVPLLARFDAALSWDGGANMLVPGLLPSMDDVGLTLPMKAAPQSHRASFRMSLLDHQSTSSGVVGRTSEHDLMATTEQSSFPSANNSSDVMPYDLNRFYLINHIPMSFWPRLIVRLLPCELLTEILTCICDKISIPNRTAPVLKCWDSRVELLPSESLPPCLVIEQIDRRHQRGNQRWSLALNGQLLWSSGSSVSLISIRVPAKTTMSQPNLGVRLMSLATEFIDQLLEDWYPAIGSRFAQDTLGSYLVYRLVPCPTCFAGDDLAMVPCFQLEECMAAVCQIPQATPSASDSSSSPNYLASLATCARGHILDVGVATPDLVFADIPKSQLVDCAQFLDKATLLGCGALGPVISISLAKLQQSYRKNALVSSQSAMGQNLTSGGGGPGDSAPMFLPRSASFGQHNAKNVAIKFFNPVDIDLSSVAGPVTTASSLADQYRRLNDQLRRRFRADPVRLACEAYTNARQELSILLCLRHAHIVGLVGVSLRPLGLLLQLAPLGSLLDWLQSYRRVGQQLTSGTVVQVVAQVADALNYLHTIGVIFRDIKSSNVLVWRFPRPSSGSAAPSFFSDVPAGGTDSGPSGVQVRLSDFSIARWSGGLGSRGQAGTPGFMAPEVIQFNGEETYTEKVDCFSFGMLVYELLTLRLPFEDRPSVNARHAVLAGLRPPPTLSMFTYGQMFTDLIASCWRKDPADRPTAAEILRLANWAGMSRVVSIASISGLPELLNTAPIPSAAGIRGAVLARLSATENRTHIDCIHFDGDECYSIQRLAEHPPAESLPVQKKGSRSNSATESQPQQAVMINCLAMSSQLIFASDVGGLIHAYRLTTGEYLGCVPAGRTGCHAVSLYCCNESSDQAPSLLNHPLGPLGPSEPPSTESSHDTLLALYSNSLLVVLRASASSNPVLAPLSRFELDPTRGTVCCMAVIRHQAMSMSGLGKSPSGFIKPSMSIENGIASKVNMFEKKSSSTRIKSFFTRPAPSATTATSKPSPEMELCGPGVSELWVGCYDGSILLCSPKSLSTPFRLRAPGLSAAQNASLLRSSTTSSADGAPIASLVVDSACESVFATLYLSSVVSRWSVRQRVLLAHFDFGEQITSILPQPGRLLLGTLSGCIISTDLSTLRPNMSFPLHAVSTLALLPIGAGSNNADDQQGTDLVVSLGRGLSAPVSGMLPQAAPTSRMCVVSLSFTAP